MRSKRLLLPALIGLAGLLLTAESARAQLFHRHHPSIVVYAIPTYSFYYVPAPTYTVRPASAAERPATIKLKLTSQDAKVWFDSKPTKAKGLERSYQTPPLAPGATYVYTLKVIPDGKAAPIEQTIYMTAGQVVELELGLAFREKQSASK